MGTDASEKPPTLEAVAKRAGVSRATVSRVVNGSPSVDPKLAKRVQAVVEELHYVPNQAARSLMTGRTNVIALVAAEADDRVFGDPFFSGIIRGVSQEVTAARRQLMLFMSQGEGSLSETESYLLAGHCDGVLLISEHGHHRIAKVLRAAGIPVIIGGRPMDPSVGVGYVDNDNIGGAAMAAEHLRVTLGRRRVATIAGPQDMSAGVDRLVGFTRGMQTPVTDSIVEFGDFTSAGGAAAMERLLEREPDLDAVFVASDLMALGAMGVLRRHGRRIPDDVAIVGFDDIALAEESTPRLTTVRQQTVEQGRRMARALISSIAERARSGGESPSGDAGIGSLLPVTLVFRESA